LSVNAIQGAINENKGYMIYVLYVGAYIGVWKFSLIFTIFHP